MPASDNDITAGQPVRVTQGVPDMTVKVNPGVTMSHEGNSYSEGDEFTLPGPLAESFAFDGQVQIV